MEEIKFGVIGCGVIGKTHAAAIAAVEGARLVAVSDVSEERARQLAERYGTRYFTDYHQMVEKADLDAVTVCTPSGMHAEPAIAALEAGVHVLVEKPIEITLERADRMIATAKRVERTLGVVFQHRFAPAFQYLKAALREGKLGRIVLGEACYKGYRSAEYYASAGWRGTWAMDGGGVLMNQAIHHVDLLQWLMGPVRSITAQVDTLVHDLEVEDTAVAILRFENGALGVIQAATSVFPRLWTRIEIAGSRGSLAVENGSLRFKYLAEEDGDEDVGFYGLDPQIGEGKAQALALPAPRKHVAQIEDFVNALREGRSPLIDGLEGRKALAINMAIYESARSGETVDMSRFAPSA